MLLAFLLSFFIGCQSNSPNSTPTTDASASVDAKSTDQVSQKPMVKPSDRKTPPPVEKPDDRWTQLNATHGSAGKIVRRDQSGKCYFENSVGGGRRVRVPIECSDVMTDPAWSKCIDGNLKKGMPSGKCMCHYESFQKPATPAPCPASSTAPPSATEGNSSETLKTDSAAKSTSSPNATLKNDSGSASPTPAKPSVPSSP